MGIVYDARKIKAYEALQEVCEYANLTGSFGDELWKDILQDTSLLEELYYYLEHHSLLGKAKCEGYSLFDLYVWQMNLYNLIADYGKNTAGCNKDTMVLKAFRMMLELKKNPEYYKKKLSQGRGMDRCQ